MIHSTPVRIMIFTLLFLIAPISCASPIATLTSKPTEAAEISLSVSETFTPLSLPVHTPTAPHTSIALQSATQTQTSTQPSSSTPAATRTYTPAPLPTKAAVPMPTIPKELFSGIYIENVPVLNKNDAWTNQVISEYATTIGISPQNVNFKFYGFGNLVFAQTDDGTPLFIAKKNSTGKYAWSLTASPKTMATLGGFYSGTYTGGYGSVADYNGLVSTQNREFNAGYVFISWADIAKYGWGAPDNDFRLAQKFQQTSVGHIIWFEAVPPSVAVLSPDKFEAEVYKFVEAALTRYKNADYITLVNEPRSDDILAQKMGRDYPVKIFRYAKEVLKKLDSSAKLALNENLNHVPADSGDSYNSANTGSTEEWLTHLAGYVDAVGVQMPIDPTHRPIKQNIVAQLKRYKDKYGVDAIVTELNVNMRNVRGDEAYKRKLQADIYQDVIEAMIEARDDNGEMICKGEYILGLLDRLSPWEREPTTWAYSPNSHPLPFDGKVGEIKKKPAYYGMLRGLMALFRSPKRAS